MTQNKLIPEEKPAPAPAAANDVALIHGPTPDGNGLQVIRARDNQLELGAIRPLREGAPISGEVVTLRPRANFPLLCDVEVHMKAKLPGTDAAAKEPIASLSHGGPAQVATEEYRRNWDAIWSHAKDDPPLAN